MDPTLRSPRLLGVALLLLCAMPSRVDAQHFVCWPIAAGDTASSLARRLTGNAAAVYDLAFQIRDPARRMFVPKSHYQYQRLQPDWQAGVARGPVPDNLIAYAPVVELAGAAMVPDEHIIAPIPQAIAAAPLAPALRADRTLSDVPFAATIGGAVLLVLLLSAAARSVAPRPMPPAARRAGEDFVAVFAQPLVDPSSRVPPIQARLRFVRRKQQLEISMAPGPGRRYPNLADHKKNVEYDVDRVIRVLGNCVLCRPPSATGKWVVVTIAPSVGSHRPEAQPKGETHPLTARAPFRIGRP